MPTLNPHSVDAILVIEDDADIANLLRIHLSDLGFRVEICRDGKTGLYKALSESYALVILDLMLPEMDGLDVCKRIRAENQYLPILMLTAKAEELDKVLGLELGADDYITKPFSIRELIARVKAIFRRIEIDQEKTLEPEVSELRYAELELDPVKRKVRLRGSVVELTAKEFDLLMLFAQHPGRAYNRQELLDLVWGYQYSGYSHTVNTHINRLRSKIEDDPSDPRFIKTVWGVGYRFIEREELAV